MGAVLLAGVPVSLYWAIQHLGRFDLVGALLWVGMSVFVGLLGVFHWMSGGDDQLGEIGQRRRASERFLAILRGRR
jgi:hypothetical protein